MLIDTFVAVRCHHTLVKKYRISKVAQKHLERGYPLSLHIVFMSAFAFNEALLAQPQE